MSNERTRILLVEDDTNHASLVCRAFEPLRAEFELTVAVTLADARARMEESDFHLVVSDLRLPDGKGTELLSDNDDPQSIPLMVVTAAGNEEEAVEAMKAGAMDYVVKSAENFADMPHLARRTLSEWRRRAEQRRAEEELRKARDELELRVEERTIELSAANAALREVIAERKRAEEARLRSEVRFQRLFDNLPDFVIVVDREAKILFANGRSHVPEPETLPGTLGISHIAPQDVGRCSEAFEQAFATGEVQSVQCETIYDEWLDCRIVPLTEEGTTPAAMIICTDISDRKHAQEALQRERRFLRRLLDLHERERQVMAYEIHDGFAQQLTGALFQLQGFRQQQTKDPQAAQKTFEMGLSSLSGAIDETRRLINGLRPPILDEAGIVAAIDYLICEATEQYGLEVEFVCDLQVSRLAPPLETTVFRIVQESLTNVRQHSGGSKAKVSLTGHDDRLNLEIKDWGIGFNPEEVDESHFGLRGIRERARLLGGKAVVGTSLGHGTRIAIDLPFLERISSDQTE